MLVNDFCRSEWLRSTLLCALTGANTGSGGATGTSDPPAGQLMGVPVALSDSMAALPVGAGSVTQLPPQHTAGSNPLASSIGSMKGSFQGRGMVADPQDEQGGARLLWLAARVCCGCEL